MMAIPFFPAISAFLLLFILAKYWKPKCKPSTPKLPPGPPKLPLIGNLHQVTGSLTHRAMASLAKKYGAIMYLKLGEHNVVVVSSSEIAKEVLKTKDIIFAQRPIFLPIQLTLYDYCGFAHAPYGDYWRQMRKICTLDLLSAKRVKMFRSIREAEVWDMVLTISSNQGFVINLGSMLFSLANMVTSRAAFGLKNKDKMQGELVSAMDKMIGSYRGLALADLYPSFKLLRHLTGLQAKVETLKKKKSEIIDRIEKHRKESKCRDDEESAPQNILDVLYELQEANDQSHESGLHLTINHVKAVTMELFTGGNETSATTMEWAMSELLKSPKALEKAQAEVREALKGKTIIEEADVEKLNYLKSVVKETLRLHPPITLMPREAREKCEIGGYEIPMKTRLFVNLWALGRDPNNWPEPDAFRPERFLHSSIDFKGTNYEYLPFGAGRRLCPGILFANPVIELALAQMLYHFDWKLPHGITPEEFDMSEAFGISVKRKHSLEVIPIVRIPFKK